MSIEISNLNFKFNKNQILNKLNIQINSAEFIGILGPNGCGKSTLLKNILKILQPNSGVIKINFKPLKEYSQKDLAKIIGFVPQKSDLALPLSVEDLILMGRYVSIKGIFGNYGSDDYRKVSEVMELLNLKEFKDRSANSLSGGEFQRVLLARAIVSDPKILLLDEPTSALDLNYAVEIMSLCKKITKKLNIFSIVVLHDLNLASIFCDKIIMLKDGKVAYSGTPKELYKKDILKEIYNLECDVLNHNGCSIIIPKNKG